MISMVKYPLKNAVSVSHMIAAPYARTARVLVDMTCGNGHDTVFLASHMPDDAQLYAFDIQACAVAGTQTRIREAGLEHKHICCRQGSHDELLAQLNVALDVVLFNLGYLPSGDHAVHTQGEITIKAIKIGLHKLAKNGIIMIAAYPGTAAGKEEAVAVQHFLQTVPQQEFDVSMWQPVNQVHDPPILYMAQKRG